MQRLQPSEASLGHKRVREDMDTEKKTVSHLLSYRNNEINPDYEKPRDSVPKTLSSIPFCKEILSHLLSIHDDETSRNELEEMFFRVDQGDSVILEEIENEEVKDSIETLFRLLKLDEVVEDGRTLYHRSKLTPHLKSTFAELIQKHPKQEEESSDEDEFGPPIPTGPVERRPAPARVSKSEQLPDQNPKASLRASWMTELPERKGGRKFSLSKNAKMHRESWTSQSKR